MMHSPPGYPTIAEMHRVMTVAKRVTLHHPVFSSVRFQWDIRNYGLVIVGEALVKDRNDASAYLRGRDPRTGEPYGLDPYVTDKKIKIENMKTVHIPDGLLRGDEDLLLDFLTHVARNFLYEFVRHEVDEMLMFDGQRVFDPHRVG